MPSESTYLVDLSVQVERTLPSWLIAGESKGGREAQVEGIEVLIDSLQCRWLISILGLRQSRELSTRTDAF
jgi:hypothetical protein